ncbi:MAG: sialidase family protein [Minicystis sp.]
MDEAQSELPFIPLCGFPTPADVYNTSYAAPSLAVAGDGTVYLAWTSLDTTFGCLGSDTTLIAKSIDGGSTWSSPVTVDAHLYHTNPGDGCSASAFYPFDPPAQPIERANAFATIDVDRNPQSAYYGAVYMVTSDYAGPIVQNTDLWDQDVFLRRSTDGGATWSARVRVNNDDPSGWATQFMPSLSVDPSDGTVNVT